MSIIGTDLPGTEYCITTVSGLEIDMRIDHVHENLHRIVIHDIATGLANQCRFTGQVDQWISIAEHSCHVADSVEEKLRGYFDDHWAAAGAFHGLMHDAPEAYIGDMSSPQKMEEPSYKIRENAFHLVIGRRFSIDEMFALEVKAADIEAFQIERACCQRHSGYDTLLPHVRKPVPQSHKFVAGWEPARSYKEFMKRFFDLDLRRRAE